MRRTLLATSLIACVLAAPARAQLANGSFEPGDGAGHFDHRAAHSGDIPGWDAIGAGVEWIATEAYGFHPPNGGFVVDLAVGGLVPGGIRQEIETEPGRVYVVAFWLGSQRAAGADGTARIEASAADERETFTIRNRDRRVLWQSHLFSFVAHDERTTLEFRCAQAVHRHFAYLDGVAVTPLPAPAPPPVPVRHVSPRVPPDPAFDDPTLAAPLGERL